MRLPVAVSTAIVLATPAPGADRPPVRGFPTGEEVLNKAAVPHEQPEPFLEYQANGFDGSIMSRVPPVGVHPRVVMSLEDIPRLRQNIVNRALAIEGDEGYEPRIFEVCKEAVVDFLTYKIPRKRALTELWLDGEKIRSEKHPWQLNVGSYGRRAPQ